MTNRIRLTMSQALVKFLDQQFVSLDGKEEKFVEAMFGIFGHGCVVGVGQALEQGGHNIRFLQGHNEQGMCHAAIGYAKQLNRRKIIPCLTSVGPGAMNMVTACGTATANRIPLLVLPGDTFATRQPDPVLQQIEQPTSFAITSNDAFKAVCKYWDRVQRPEQLMTAMLNAMRVLTDPAETGAVCVALPQDVEGEAYDYPEYFFEKRVWYLDRRPITEDQLARAVDRIRKAEKPLVICGGGVRYSEAGDALIAFAEAFNLPIAETQAGKSVVHWTHPLNVGGLGVTGGKAANLLAKDADLIIAVGTRLTDFTTASKSAFKNPNAKMLSLNICPFDAFKMDATAIIADARESLTALTGALREIGYRSAYKTEIADVRDEWNKIVDDFYAQQDTAAGLSQTRALGIINQHMHEKDIAVGSAGSLPGDMQRLFRPGIRDTYHMEYGYSCMGYEVNAAVGVKLALPDRQVYTFLGDGSFIMAHSELYTAVQEGLKVNFMVFDNAGWGCIENLQNSQGTKTFGTVFKARNESTDRLDGAAIPIDFAKIGEGYGLKSYRVETSAELEAALADADKQPGSVLFDIKVVPGTMTPGFESWWRVGTAEVSTDANVQAAYEVMREMIKKARDY